MRGKFLNNWRSTNRYVPPFRVHRSENGTQASPRRSNTWVSGSSSCSSTEECPLQPPSIQVCWVTHHTRCFTYVLSHSHNRLIGKYLIPLLRVKRGRHRETKFLAQSHTIAKGYSCLLPEDWLTAMLMFIPLKLLQKRGRPRCRTTLATYLIQFNNNVSH